MYFLGHGSGCGFSCPCPSTMVPEAACRAEGKVKVMKGNQALERGTTAAAALDIADYGLGDLWARGSHLGSQSALGSQSSLQKRRNELRACYWAGDPHFLRKELTPQSSKNSLASPFHGH